MVGMDPVANGQLTKEEIKRCEADPKAKLQIARTDLPLPTARQKGPRYTPVTTRGDKPDAVAWLLKNTPELSGPAIPPARKSVGEGKSVAVRVDLCGAGIIKKKNED